MAFTKTPQPCGTQATYHRHLRHGETPCDDCRTAVNLYERQRQWAKGRRPRQPRRHGTFTMYLRKCRCGPCRRANADMSFSQRAKSDPRKRVSIKSVILDVLETRGDRIETALLIDLVLELHPDWNVLSIKRVLYREVVSVVDRNEFGWRWAA